MRAGNTHVWIVKYRYRTMLFKILSSHFSLTDLISLFMLLQSKRPQGGNTVLIVKQYVLVTEDFFCLDGSNFCQEESILIKVAKCTYLKEAIISSPQFQLCEVYRLKNYECKIYRHCFNVAPFLIKTNESSKETIPVCMSL